MIEAIGLTKRYGRRTAVEDLSFSVPTGGITGLLGPSGAGKTTALRMILGVSRPDAGWVRIDGRRYRELDRPLRKIGGVLEGPSVHPRRAVRAHLDWLAKTNGLPARRVAELLALTGLTGVRDRRAGELSSDELQRLGIASALVADPEILVVDEPGRGMQPAGVDWLHALLLRLGAEGRTILLTGSRLASMAALADRLVVISRGKLVTRCPTEEFLDSAGEATVRVLSPQRSMLAARLRGRGATVHEDLAGQSPALLVSGMPSAVVGELAEELGAAVHALSVHRQPPAEVLGWAGSPSPRNGSGLAGGWTAPFGRGNPHELRQPSVLVR
ncbi:ABC transporter ATP-binding protein [Actinoalloteichus hymeniacidonis]|uniref:ABC-type multidrug transport system, ATPase component n=1 Tax=Actinoalloteichus hymeniacidonis TaxID=340345 RepID=A0AAC9N017_9PSEU|nr:ATP-binding cassette domain-containing protein [Actinoalloteichus hymeniacidonis]AOS66028.1 ABC-type multidrug transport system, ATPase component [Actinoalloteichus hymeniacidonis]MBB5905870.1 ABC-2 type transport system ATP-binding protein [Actinoalloteichus hymeniacidonis]